jgi:hypothetical protein
MRLEGFNGMRFGTGSAEAKQALGPNRKDGTQRTRATRQTINYIQQETTIQGDSYLVAYFFGTDDGLSLVRLVPRGGLVSSTDKSACLGWGAKVIAALTRQYGPPDSEKNTATDREAVFAFRDGNEIQVMASPLPGGCLAAYQYATPEGKKI